MFLVRLEIAKRFDLTFRGASFSGEDDNFRRGARRDGDVFLGGLLERETLLIGLLRIGLLETLRIGLLETLRIGLLETLRIGLLETLLIGLLRIGLLETLRTGLLETLRIGLFLEARTGGEGRRLRLTGDEDFRGRLSLLGLLLSAEEFARRLGFEATGDRLTFCSSSLSILLFISSSFVLFSSSDRFRN